MCTIYCVEFGSFISATAMHRNFNFNLPFYICNFIHFCTADQIGAKIMSTDKIMKVAAYSLLNKLGNIKFFARKML